VIAEAERAKSTLAAARRLVGLVTAAWVTFDEIAAASPAELRKGPGRWPGSRPRSGGKEVRGAGS
jgi:hypothetical protein